MAKEKKGKGEDTVPQVEFEPLPPPAMQAITARIVGLSPLMQHAFGNGEEINLPGAAGGTGTRPMAGGVEPTPREVAAQCLYRNKRGEIYLPGTAFLRLLRESAANYKLKGSRKSAKWLIPSAVFILHDEVVVTNGDGETPVTTFEVDSRPVTIPATKGRVMRHRPKWDVWSATVELEVDTALFTPAFVHRLLEEGGRRLGVGDYRPEKGGPFGRFRVVHFEEH